MRWIPGSRSENLEDRRGQRFGGFGRLGLGGAVIVVVLSLVFGRDFTGILTDGGDVGSQSAPDGSAPPVQSTPQEERLVDFVSFVLDSAQATWARILPQEGVGYRPAKLVLFRDAVQSACGFGQAASGPFYCPGDEKVYIDLGFFEELKTRFGAPGDFAQAYVLAHELGHHVQNLRGTMGAVRDNQQSVQIELQADCLAGVWGYHASRQNLLEPGDVDEGLGAAAAVGDDRVQGMSTGRVSPENFTHGSSAQRIAAFRRGLTSGRVADCGP